MRKYYVTVQLTNGGIESIEIELSAEDSVNEETFKHYVKLYDQEYMDWRNHGLWSMGHIIAWSKIE